MKLQFALNNKIRGPYYFGYSPVECTLKVTDGKKGARPVTIALSNVDAKKGGQVVFYESLKSKEAHTLSLKVPGDGTPVKFYVGGKFQAPSLNDLDAGINFVFNRASVLVVRCMVRVRKNANKLSDGERDRFLSAFVKFLASGKYQSFLDMHTDDTSSEIHGRPSFLPWHRTYVLDLERHLQQIDATVTIPYWKFEEPAPHVFHLDFMGVPSATGTHALQFSNSNPMVNWQISGLPKLVRNPQFDTVNSRANVETENTTLGRGPGFLDFAEMEDNPHGNAHVSFTGPIAHIGLAPRDPLFFMLHCNVDRLWATWQALGSANNRINPASLTAYPYQGVATDPGAQVIGDNAGDTSWPWNGVTGDGSVAHPRPATAPGGPMIGSPFTTHPGTSPRPGDMIDYQGRVTHKSDYFDYDSIPFIN